MSGKPVLRRYEVRYRDLPVSVCLSISLSAYRLSVCLSVCLIKSLAITTPTNGDDDDDEVLAPNGT